MRLDLPAYDLGEADWLLYRRRCNPYRLFSYAHTAYNRGFAVSKHVLPKPSWPAL